MNKTITIEIADNADNLTHRAWCEMFTGIDAAISCPGIAVRFRGTNGTTGRHRRACWVVIATPGGIQNLTDTLEHHAKTLLAGRIFFTVGETKLFPEEVKI